MPEPLTAADLDREASQRAPGGGTMYVRAACHPAAGLIVTYIRGVMVCYCNGSRCRAEILRVQLDPGDRRA